MWNKCLKCKINWKNCYAYCGSVLSQRYRELITTFSCDIHSRNPPKLAPSWFLTFSVEEDDSHDPPRPVFLLLTVEYQQNSNKWLLERKWYTPPQHNTTRFTADNRECIYACKTVPVFLQFDTDVKKHFKCWHSAYKLHAT